MNALESLKKEHVLISRALTALDAYSVQLSDGTIDGVMELQRFARFFTDFAELWHHGKEEDILLPALVRHGFAWDEGAVARVREDHEQAGYLARVLQQAAAQESWTEEDRRHTVAAIRSFTDFERRHMQTEETSLYEAAIERLPDQELADMERRMVELEHHRFGTGGYERLQRDADELFRRYEPGAL